MNKKWIILAFCWAVSGFLLCGTAALLSGFDGYRIAGWPQLSFQLGPDCEMIFFSFPR